MEKQVSKKKPFLLYVENFRRTKRNFEMNKNRNTHPFESLLGTTDTEQAARQDGFWGTVERDQKEK